MLSARELAPELPEKARTWVNEHLQFTHGYGLVMNFVSQSTEGGLPLYLIDNIPPVARYGLTVRQPAIYFGEKMPGYRIVATGIKEFDYPKGEENVYASYQGKGGIPLDSFWKRILFSWYLPDINILLTSYLGPESRIQLWRDIPRGCERSLLFSSSTGSLSGLKRRQTLLDPGCLYDLGPLSLFGTLRKPSGQTISYIRNSVKVIVDAYDGSVSFYVMDPPIRCFACTVMPFPGFSKISVSCPGYAAAPAFSGRSFDGPGRPLPDLSHDQSSGLL